MGEDVGVVQRAVRDRHWRRGNGRGEQARKEEMGTRRGRRREPRRRRREIATRGSKTGRAKGEEREGERGRERERDRPLELRVGMCILKGDIERTDRERGRSTCSTPLSLKSFVVFFL
jgi:hypothetical protein